MLSSEQARAELRQFAAASGTRAGPGVRALPLMAGGLREYTALAALVADPAGMHGAAGVAAELDDLSPRALMRVFRALSPSLHQELAVFWQWSTGMPYQTGPMRRPFRSPIRADGGYARITTVVPVAALAARYPQDIGWFARWAPYLGWNYQALGLLLASAVDNGDRAVLQSLIDSAHGRDPVGGMGSHVVIGLLSSSNPAAWSVIEDLLLAAQREEGLRQAILEHIDFAHPVAFRRMLALITANGLTRFAATVRAAGVWFGEQFDVRQSRLLDSILVSVSQYLAQPPESIDPAGGDASDTFLRLWSIALRDVRLASGRAAGLLASPAPEVRLAAARLLAEARAPMARQLLTPALGDTDPRVVAAALQAFPVPGHTHDPALLDEAQITGLLASMDRAAAGRAGKQQIGVLGSLEVPYGTGALADALIANAPGRLQPLIAAAHPRATSIGRTIRAQRLAADPQANRAALIALLSDPAETPRSIAAQALRPIDRVTAAEALQLEAMLDRKASGVRGASLRFLARQSPEALAATVARLRAGSALQQAAADELAGSAAGPNRQTASIPAALVVRDAARSPVHRPAAVGVPAGQHQRVRLLCSSLLAWLDEHRDVEVSVGGDVRLLADVPGLWWSDDGGRPPLAEIIDPWWQRISPGLAMGGLEAALVANLHPLSLGGLPKPAETVLGRLPERFSGPGRSGLPLSIVRLMAERGRRADWADGLLDALQTALAGLDTSTLDGPDAIFQRRRRRPPELGRYGYRGDAREHFRTALGELDGMLARGWLSRDQLARYWRLLRFLDEPEGRHDRAVGAMVPAPELASRFGPLADSANPLVPDQPWRVFPAPATTVAAVEAGIASPEDWRDQLLHDRFTRVRRGRSAIWEATAIRRPAWLADAPIAHPIVEEVIAAAVAVELRRGDLATQGGPVVADMRSVEGSPTLLAAATALGKSPLTRGYAWARTRDSSLSHLIRISRPGATETAEDFAAAVERADVPRKRLIEVGVYAPQWAALIESTLGWPGYAEAVRWLHAHTKGEDWNVDADLRQEWNAQVAEHTPLDASDLTRGAVDVQWFARVLDRLGGERFDTVLAAAKYASSSGGHKRAELYAGVLRGSVGEAELLTRIESKRHQDSVRALGLVPPPDAGPERTESVLRRYEFLRAFVASDRTSGSARRASESLAVQVGLENLARSAGYRDPQRLVWAMEAAAVADLAAGPVTATEGDVEVRLSIGRAGDPVLRISRAGRPLKSLPRALAKVEHIAAVTSRSSELRKQAARMRRSLEQTCVAGEEFSRAELAELLGHPVAQPMLASLVLVSREGVMGLPTMSPDVIIDAELRQVPADGSAMRIAHPVDLLRCGQWPQWQHALFTGESRQPFRQVFRELYTPTQAERSVLASPRYAGHQVQQRRAAALFGARGWVADFGAGFNRTYHAERITAWCDVLFTRGTPGEVEDATMGDVSFHRVGASEPLPLGEVPERIFSEVMRDLDLVVSVAHAGGLDPESSQSTVQMRRRLVEETCELLGLRNVETTDHHAIVRGTLATYSINLGSGVVHRQPGAAICIIPVSAQHRGRIFLPFVDDDPRTAEVLSKLVMLSRDDKIKDPTVLDQLRSA